MRIPSLPSQGPETPCCPGWTYPPPSKVAYVTNGLAGNTQRCEEQGWGRDGQ